MCRMQCSHPITSLQNSPDLNCAIQHCLLIDCDYKDLQTPSPYHQQLKSYNLHLPMTTIRALNQDITIFSCPFSRFGLFKIGGRATAIKLQNADVVIVSAIKSTPEIQNTIKALGTVKYLVAPDVEHHLNLDEYAKLYPNAKIIAVEGLPEKHPHLKFHKVFGESKYDNVEIGWESEIETVYFPGHSNKELALLHKPTKTLIEADIVFNLPAFEQYKGSSSSAGIGGFLSPFKNLSLTHKSHRTLTWNMLAKDKKSFKASLLQVQKWDFVNLIPCHGEVVEGNAKTLWDDHFKQFFEGKGAEI